MSDKKNITDYMPLGTPYADVMYRDAESRLEEQTEVSWYKGYKRVHIYTKPSVARSLFDWASKKYGAANVTKRGALIDINGIKTEKEAKKVFQYIKTKLDKGAWFDIETSDSVEISGEEIFEAEGDKEKYKAFFNKKLKKYGVTEPDQLSGEDKKKFFQEIEDEWTTEDPATDDGDEPNESFEYDDTMKYLKKLSDRINK